MIKGFSFNIIMKIIINKKSVLLQYKLKYTVNDVKSDKSTAGYNNYFKILANKTIINNFG